MLLRLMCESSVRTGDVHAGECLFFHVLMPLNKLTGLLAIQVWHLVLYLRIGLQLDSGILSGQRSADMGKENAAGHLRHRNRRLQDL